MTIGIPRALLYYRYGTLWETFFHELGHKTVLSPQTNKKILDEGDRLAIDECCLSSKLFLGHIAALQGHCDAVFVPRIANFGENGILCSRFEALYDVARATFRETDLTFLTCNVDVQQHALPRDAYTKLGQRLGHTKQAAVQAYNDGLKAQAEAMQQRGGETQQLLSADGTRILVVGRSYNLHDAYIGQPIMQIIRDLDAVAVPADGVDPRRARKASYDICDDVPWMLSRELLGAISLFRDQIDGIVLITAFPCGPDSMVNEMIIRRVRDKPILNLLLDAQDGTAGVETRLESFVDIIRFRKGARGQEVYRPGASDPGVHDVKGADAHA